MAEELHRENTTDKTVNTKTRVYLDNCAYNRPYDDQSQIKIELETQAKLKIQRMIKNSELSLLSSYMSLYECGEHPDPDKAALITDFINTYSSVYVDIANQDAIEEKAREIMATGVKFKDACHITAAIYAKADYLITTDKRMLKYSTDEIKLLNPVDFFFQEDEQDSND